MKTRKKLLSLLLVLLLALSLAPAAFGAFTVPGDQESISGEVDSTVFLAGENPNSSADIKGILFEAGSAVRASGSSEYAFLAGNSVTFAGTNINDAFLGGNLVSFSGDCGRDLAIAGNAVEISGSVARDLMAGGRSVVISGSVGGNVIIAAESITIRDDAEIGGRLRYNSSANISAPAELLAWAEVYDDGGSQDGESNSIFEMFTDNSSTENSVPENNVAENSGGADNSGADSSPAENSGTESGSTESSSTPDSGNTTAPTPPAETKKTSSFASTLKKRAFNFVGLLLIAYFFLWLTPLWEKLDEKYTGKKFGTFAKAFGIGLAVLAALPLASIILMVSGIGLRPAFVLIFVVNAVLIAAPIFLGFFLGSLLWRKALKKGRNYWAELPIGLAIWAILISIPRVGFLVRVIAACLGVGVVTLLLGKNKSAALPAAPVQAAVEPNVGEAQANAPTYLPPTDKQDSLTPPSEK